jgi:hypothetical protein
MTNRRPKMIRPIPWPWKNKIDGNGFPVVVKRSGYGTMPDTVACFDWDHWEHQEVEYLKDVEGPCTRDLKSVFTTAVRMYGFEQLYTELESGNNVFVMIANEFRRWIDRYRTGIKSPWVIIGDDIAYKDNLFLPPAMIRELLFPAWKILMKGHLYKLVFHSDGDVSDVLDAIMAEFRPNYLVVQAHLNARMVEACQRIERGYGPCIVNHGSVMNAVSLPTKEQWHGTA